MIFIASILVLLTVLALYIRHVYSQLEARGLKHLKPVPLLGNMGPILLKKKQFVHATDDEYKAFPGERFIGHYQFLKGDVMIRDVEMMKSIAIKDFDHFTDHRDFVDENLDPLFGSNLLAMKGQRWRDMRATLSPAFTSSKLKHMVPFIQDVGEQVIKAIGKNIKESGTNYIDLELRDLLTRYTNDVIASVAFGLKVDSHADPDNEFFKTGHMVSNFSFSQLFMFFIGNAFPKLMKAMNQSIFPKSMGDFFRNLVLGSMKDREERNLVRRDMIHLLMEARKGQLSHDVKSTDNTDAGFATAQESAVGKKTTDRVWTDDELVGQAIVFFTAGFDTVSTAMTFLLYELAVNPEVQQKLVKEVTDHELNGGKTDYNTIVQLPYLDMVISESLRMWPPAGATDRLCTRDYNLGKPNPQATKDFILKKGEAVFIPIYSIHHDPQYYPEPYKFDPERFSEENKHKIKPFTYMPFGLGPRNCIGSRLALCEIKVLVYQLLQQYELQPCEKTTIPVELSTDSFNFRMKGGTWIRFKAKD